MARLTSPAALIAGLSASLLPDKRRSTFLPSLWMASTMKKVAGRLALANRDNLGDSPASLRR
jgi:hypothetical protein